MPAMTNCPYCGRLTDPNLANCVHCGGFLQKGPSQAQQVRKPSASSSQTCPSCGALVHAGDIICAACGTNLLTGQKIIDSRAPRSRGLRISPTMIIAALGIAALIIVSVILVYVLTRDPVRQATDLASRGLLSEASQLLTEHVRKHSDDARAHFELGKIQWRTKQAPQAADSFEHAAKLDPQNMEALLYGAVCLATVGNTASNERAIKLLDAFSRDRTDDLRALTLLGFGKGASGDYAGLVKALDKVAAAEPGNAPVRVGLGAAYLLQGDKVQSGVELMSAVQSGGQTLGDALVVSSESALLSDDTKSAVDQLSRSIDSAPSVESDALIQLGLLQIAVGDFSEGQRYLAAALAQDKSNAMARFFNAICQLGQGLDTEALTNFEAMSQNKGPYAAEAAAQAAEIYFDRDSFERARDAAERATTLGNDSAALNTLKGRIQIALSQDSVAQDSFRRAIEADPNYAPAHLENGLLYVKRGILGEGVKELERYIELIDPAVPDAHVEEVQAILEQLKKAEGSKAAANASPQDTEKAGSI